MHYIAALWNPEDPQAGATAASLANSLPGWQCAFSGNGVLVFLKSPRDSLFNVYLLQGERGIILGFLFPINQNKFTGSALTSIDEPTAREIISTNARSLLENYWGGYVAFLMDGERNISRAIRDCSGKFPCYHLRHAQVEFVFADIADIEPLQLRKVSINWPYLISYIREPTLETRECGLTEVTELLAGDCLEVCRDTSHQFLIWDPYEIYRQSPIDSYSDGLTLMQRTTQYCIDAWASVYDNIAHHLSGGFDSTVVLSCLRRSPRRPQVICLHQYTDSPRDDERRFARLVANQTNVRLFELHRNPDAKFSDTDISLIPISSKPSASAFFAASEGQACNELALKLGASSCWTGQGGDHIFFQIQTSLSAPDYAYSRGFDLGFLSAISDAARLSKESYFHILRSAIFHKYFRSTPTPPVHALNAERFLDTSAFDYESCSHKQSPRHPDTCTDIPPGKDLHIALLCEAINRNRQSHTARCIDTHHPLLSQPMLSLAIQTPLYLLVRGGLPRAMARDAFRSIIPNEVAERMDKGETSSHVSAIIRRSRAPLRELMQNGILAGTGFLRTANVIAAIDGRTPIRFDEIWPFLACISTEAWLRAWYRTQSHTIL
jgi:asparagine synthase (glutamine-hydrolysing)